MTGTIFYLIILSGDFYDVLPRVFNTAAFKLFLFELLVLLLQVPLHFSTFLLRFAEPRIAHKDKITIGITLRNNCEYQTAREFFCTKFVFVNTISLEK